MASWIALGLSESMNSVAAGRATSARVLSGCCDAHAGATILVCGSGYSLNALVQPEHFFTVGVTDIGRFFVHPTYLVALNPRRQFGADRLRHVKESRAQAIFTQLDLGLSHPNVVQLRLGVHGCTDPNALPHTRNSRYLAVCLAHHMGATRIGLIGVDFTDHHFFAATGRHPLTRMLPQIDREYACLAEIWDARRRDRQPQRREPPHQPAQTTPRRFSGNRDTRVIVQPVDIISYATTPVAGVPAILARCTAARTPHRARCVWATNDYGNGVRVAGDIEWSRDSSAAQRALTTADLVIIHNGKVKPRHRPLLAGKPTSRNDTRSSSYSIHMYPYEICQDLGAEILQNENDLVDLLLSCPEHN
jgi:hypothetical protein